MPRSRAKCLLVGLVVLQVASVASAEGRLLGLERLYFVHAGTPTEVIEIPGVVGVLLPQTISPTRRVAEAGLPANKTHGMSLSDFALPPIPGQPERWLREVVEPSQFRAARVWWALYVEGRRSDVWWYHPGRGSSGEKFLANYRLESVENEARGGVALRVRGEMFRPQGAWSLTRKTFFFEPDAHALVLARVRNDFGFFHGYDLGEHPAETGVSTERQVGDHFELRRIAAVPPHALDRCGFISPRDEASIDVSLDRFEMVARCVLRLGVPVITRRSFGDPSFIERDGGLP